MGKGKARKKLLEGRSRGKFREMTERELGLLGEEIKIPALPHSSACRCLLCPTNPTDP